MRVLVLATAITVSACSSPGIIDTGRVAVVSAEQLPQPMVADFQGGTREQYVGPFDTLNVEVFGLPELSRDIVVGANGKISLPVAGTIDAAGQTTAQLTSTIAQRLRQGSVRDPQVIVNVKQMVSQVVVVEGEVRKPGVLPVLGRMTMLRAIAQAEGTNEFAKSEHVVVLRTVNGQKMAALYNLAAIRKGAYGDPEIYPGDTVVVGEDASRRVLPVILQGATAVLAPLIYLLN